MTVTRPPEKHEVGAQVHPPHRLDHIVVGVDFAGPSLGVAEWVGRYLARTAQLTLVHVTPMTSRPDVLRIGSHRMSSGGRPAAERVRSLRGALRGLASVSGGNRTTVAVRIGDPAAQLAAYADLVGADLIVIGGSSAYHVAPTDATTEQLLRRTRRPVLVTRGVSEAPKTVLATAAGGVSASLVLAAARMVARLSAARVLWWPSTEYAPTGPVQWREDSDRTARNAHASSELVGAEVEHAKEVLDAAERLRADILVVGGHRPLNDGVSRDDTEDLVRTLVRMASRSVLVVRDDSTGPPCSRSRLEGEAPSEGPHANPRDVTSDGNRPRPAAECFETVGAACAYREPYPRAADI